MWLMGPRCLGLESDDTLEKFLDFSCVDGGYGEVLDERAFWEEFTGAVDHGAELARVREVPMVGGGEVRLI